MSIKNMIELDKAFVRVTVSFTLKDPAPERRKTDTSPDRAGGQILFPSQRITNTQYAASKIPLHLESREMFPTRHIAAGVVAVQVSNV
jgi:hypothetical protein